MSIKSIEINGKVYFKIESNSHLDFNRFKNEVGYLWKYINCKGVIVVDYFMAKSTSEILEKKFNIPVLY